MANTVRVALLALALAATVVIAGCAENESTRNNDSNDGDEVAGTSPGGASVEEQENSQGGTTGAYG